MKAGSVLGEGHRAKCKSKTQNENNSTAWESSGVVLCFDTAIWDKMLEHKIVGVLCLNAPIRILYRSTWWFIVTQYGSTHTCGIMLMDISDIFLIGCCTGPDAMQGVHGLIPWSTQDFFNFKCYFKYTPNGMHLGIFPDLAINYLRSQIHLNPGNVSQCVVLSFICAKSIKRRE